MAALRERLLTLEVERDRLVGRARELEAALAETSEEAKRRASEAVQLEALLDFYERDAQPAVAAPRPPAPPAAAKAATYAATTPAPGADAHGDEAAPSAEPTAPQPAATAKPAARHRSPTWAGAWRDTAIAALRDRGGPMHYRELHGILAARGFAFGGKSPEATFLASLHRERSTFQLAGRGTYWLVESPEGAPAPVEGRARRRTSRPKPIGRAKKGGK